MHGTTNKAYDSNESKSEDSQTFDVNPSPIRQANFEYKDGGWGWVVVIASSYCFGILYGMVGNYALIYNKFEIVYNSTENHVLYAGNSNHSPVSKNQN